MAEVTTSAEVGTGMPDSGSDGGSDDARAKAQEAKDGAQEKAQEVMGQAQEKAQEAKQQASGRVREQVDQRSTQAGEQVAGTAGDLRTVGEELRKQGKETPAKLADQAADRTEQVGRYLKESDADRILGDVEDFARRQPWAVVAGGLVLGFAASRFLKASSSQRYGARSSGGTSSESLATPDASTRVSREVPDPATGGNGVRTDREPGGPTVARPASPADVV